MKMVDRAIVAALAIAVVAGGWLAGMRPTNVAVNVPELKPIPITLNEGPFSYVASSTTREVCDELEGRFFESAGYGKWGDCIYVANPNGAGH
jgi:hypothetical protein